jgi:hypothetical protein
MQVGKKENGCSWVIARKSWRARYRPAAHPALAPFDAPERTGPIGPDDDPEFLRMLDRLIGGTSDSGKLSIVLTVLLHRADRRHGDRSDSEKVRTWVASSEGEPLASSS